MAGAMQGKDGAKEQEACPAKLLSVLLLLLVLPPVHRGCSHAGPSSDHV